MLMVAAPRGLGSIKGTREVPATRRAPCFSLPSWSQIRQPVVTRPFCVGPAGRRLSFSVVEDGHILVGHLSCEAPGSPEQVAGDSKQAIRFLAGVSWSNL